MKNSRLLGASVSLTQNQHQPPAPASQQYFSLKKISTSQPNTVYACDVIGYQAFGHHINVFLYKRTFKPVTTGWFACLQRL